MIKKRKIPTRRKVSHEPVSSASPVGFTATVDTRPSCPAPPVLCVVLGSLRRPQQQQPKKLIEKDTNACIYQQKLDKSQN